MLDMELEVVAENGFQEYTVLDVILKQLVCQ
jgi:hypothetical protein